MRKLKIKALNHYQLRNERLNHTVLSLCKDIESYASFWTFPLYLFFLNHITLQSYLSYVVFFIDTIPFYQKFVFVYFVLEIDLGLFLLIQLCSRIVRLNGAIEGANRQFYMLCLQGNAFKNSNIHQQLKVLEIMHQQ